MKFDSWLENNTNLKESSINLYVSAIQGKLSEWANESNLILGSILDIKETDKFSVIESGLRKHPSFVRKNKTGHSKYGSALSQYRKYLEYTEKQSAPSLTKDPISNDKLKEKFNLEVLHLCDLTKQKTSYNPKAFRGKVLRVGAFDATTDILNSTQNNWKGFTELFINNRLDLSLEFLVLQEKWSALFTFDQLKTAQDRLKQVNFPNIPSLPIRENESNKRRSYKTNSIIRDSKLAKEIKELYQYKCQVCNTALVIQNGKYAEAAHIKPLGEPHNGEDSIDNIMCLCPNHHKLFDLGGFFVLDDFTIPVLGMKLTVHDKHNIKPQYFEYHRNWFNDRA